MNVADAKVVCEQEMAIACSVPAVGPILAAAILAETGDSTRFSNGKQIAAWAGLAPSVHRSACKFVTTIFRGQVLSGLSGAWLRRLLQLFGICL